MILFCGLFIFSSCSTADTELLAIKNAGLGTPRVLVGIILPSSPNTYAQITAKMSKQKNYKEGFFKFTTGDIYGIPVVLSSPPPVGSFSLTAIDTYLMEKTFDPVFVIDPGTAGSHLPDLSMGDVVIGARVVNFSNYMTKSDGKIVPGQFSSLVTDDEGYKQGNPNPEYIYANPELVRLAAVAATKVARFTPANILSAPAGRRPWILAYGTQGSGDAWLRNIKQIKKSTQIFHEADEAGNYPIALVSTMNKIPFIEIHAISDAAMNVPTVINQYFHQCSEYAQKRSNLIALKMIEIISSEKDGKVAYNLMGGFTDPWPNGKFIKAMKPPVYVSDWTKKYGVYR
jgi:nucleoside phosphorylase